MRWAELVMESVVVSVVHGFSGAEDGRHSASPAWLCELPTLSDWPSTRNAACASVNHCDTSTTLTLLPQSPCTNTSALYTPSSPALILHPSIHLKSLSDLLFHPSFPSSLPMQSPYQPLVQGLQPHVPSSRPSVAASSVYHPYTDAWDCTSCCKPGCLGRHGVCPCFCSTLTFFHSSVVVCLSLSILFLVVAMAKDKYFSSDSYRTAAYGYSSSAEIGPWRWCVGGGSGSDCMPADSRNIWTMDGVMFNAFRALLVTSTFLVLVTALVCAVRLGLVQRGMAVGRKMEWTMAVGMGLGWLLCVVSFSLASGLPGTYKQVDVDGNAVWLDYSASWFLHMTAVILLTVAVVTHFLTAWHLAGMKGRAEGQWVGEETQPQSAAQGQGHSHFRFFGSGTAESITNATPADPSTTTASAAAAFVPSTQLGYPQAALVAPEVVYQAA